MNFLCKIVVVFIILPWVSYLVSATLQNSFAEKLLSSNSNTKLLVTTGYIVNQGTDPKPSEVIDLLDAESKCDQFPIFQDRIIGASGALLQNNQTLVCGGYKGNDELRCQVQRWNGLRYEWYTKIKNLVKPRIWSASIPLNDNQLLITGGLSGPNSMEIVDINEETSTELSVNLTMDFWRHCIAQVDDNHVVLIGGNQAKTLILDTSNFNNMEVGPRMEEERVWLSCGSFKNSVDNTNYVIAAGGIGRKGPLKSTVLWDTKSNAEWVQGPDLPQACSYSSMVSYEGGVILLGCDENPDAIYALISINGGLEWIELTQKLQFPRTSALAMLIPDELTNCH